MMSFLPSFVSSSSFSFTDEWNRIAREDEYLPSMAWFEVRLSS